MFELPGSVRTLRHARKIGDSFGLSGLLHPKLVRRSPKVSLSKRIAMEGNATDWQTPQNTWNALRVFARRIGHSYLRGALYSSSAGACYVDQSLLAETEALVARVWSQLGLAANGLHEHLAACCRPNSLGRAAGARTLLRG